MSASSRSKDMKTYIHSIIGIIIMFGFGCLPAPEPITPMGMQILGIFIGLIYLWCLVDLLWPSVLSIIALGMTEYTDFNGAMGLAFGNAQAILMLFLLSIFVVLEDVGLNRYISSKLLSLPILKGRPWLFVFAWFMIAYILSTLTNGIAVILFMWNIFYNLAEQTGYKKGDSFVCCMLVGTAIAASFGFIALPFRSAGYVFVSALQNISGVMVPSATYILAMFFMCVVTMLNYMVIMRFFYKVDVEKIKSLDNSVFKEKDMVLNRLQKFLIGYLAAFIICLAAPSMLPKTWFITQFFAKITVVGTSMLFFVGLAIIRFDGKPLMNFQQLANKLAWSLFFLLVAALAISSILVSEGTGISAFVMGILNPLFAGKSVIFFYAVLLFFAIAITCFSNNVVTGMLMLTFLYMFSMQNAVNLIGMEFLISIAVIMAFLTPSASIPGAMIYDSEWMDTKDILKYTFAAEVYIYLTLCIIGIPLVSIVF